MTETGVASSAAATPLLEIRELRTYFHGKHETVRAVDDIDLAIEEGETLGLVGESGSGKSVTSLSVMRLLESTASIETGEIAWFGRDLVHLPNREMRDLRGKDIGMIFQEPGTSLNPVFRVGDQVGEALRVHLGMNRKQARQRTIELFEEVGIPEPERRIDTYPHEMSGGQKQRVMIAMALSCNPKLLIADEPTTALDVTIQAQILDLIRRLRDERGMSILFISHDLGVIAEIADRIAVMFRGRIVERGAVTEVFGNPRHPYTKGLLACRPHLDRDFRRLPTVADFMDVDDEGDGDEIRITERELTPESLDQLVGRGRGRLLHPQRALEDLGYAGNPGPGDRVADGIEPLLQVRDLRVYYPIKSGFLRRQVGDVKAVDGISFDVYPGQTLGLVGESGCGKTTTGLALLRLIDITGGTVRFEDQDVTTIPSSRLRSLRGRMQIILQDPYSSLNPRMTVEAMLSEAMAIHKIGDGRSDRRDRAARLLEEVGMETGHLRRYPHEFSGGQRQRISVARALAVQPKLIICDESVSALDVSVQAQVLNLLKDLQEERDLTYIFISHDLSVVKFMSDMMAVMLDGRIVEQGPSEAIYMTPREEYTRRLIEAVPDDSIANIESRQQQRREARRRRQAN
ncbi:MAG: ABC transporter ATP-binding protein [Holophagales bacterium]|nr:ABC transporter ATP-binding protein [Holophagales bacterium]MYG31783.1 ABC transporter ATP-binding protein [Holophagales bacterium]MYI79625.1 ABC transporter ATP-binding protein [Holophagales bacterium]